MAGFHVVVVYGDTVKRQFLYSFIGCIHNKVFLLKYFGLIIALVILRKNLQRTLISEKGKPVAMQGRKVKGPRWGTAWLPKSE